LETALKNWFTENNICFEFEFSNAPIFYLKDFKIIFVIRNKRNFIFEINSVIFPDFKVIYLWESYWIVSRDLVLARISSILNLNHKIPGRLCTVKRIGKSLSEHFLEQNHLQKNTGGRLKYGLFLPKKYYRVLPYNLAKGYSTQDELLVAVMVFSNAKKYYSEDKIIISFEMIRFATLAGINIHGGMSKLIKYFTLEKTPGNIMTYIDLDWSDASNFINLGFKISEKITDQYYMLTKNGLSKSKGENEDWNVKSSGSVKLILSNFEKFRK